MPKPRTPISAAEFEAQIDAEIADLERLLEGRRKVKAALSGLNGAAGEVATTRKIQAVRSEERAPVEISQTDAIKSVLADAGGSMRVAEILDAVRAKFGLELPKASVGPTLARLKSSGFVIGKDGLWRLRKKRG